MNELAVFMAKWRLTAEQTAELTGLSLSSVNHKKIGSRPLTKSNLRTLKLLDEKLTAEGLNNVSS